MSHSLDNQTVIVTGASNGIGLAISRRFAALGATVIGWDLSAASDACFTAQQTVDVRDEDQINAAFGVAVEHHGRIDCVIANAGINGPTKPAWEYSLAEWQSVLDVDLTGVFLTTRPAMLHMRERGKGRIIVIASVAAKEGNPGACAYGAAKAGVAGYVKGIARELLPSAITVNCIAPVITETDLLIEMTDDYIADKKGRIPMGRFCTPDEIAGMAAFIAGPDCAFTTGQIFDVTGGRATY